MHIHHLPSRSVLSLCTTVVIALCAVGACRGGGAPGLPKEYTFSASLKITDYLPGAASASAPFSAQKGIAVHGTHVAAVWADDRTGNYDIYCAWSSDGGKSWGLNTRITDDDTAAWKFQPSIAVDPTGGLVVVWVDYRQDKRKIFFSRSTDYGATWSANVPVDDDAQGTAFKYDPVVAVDNAGVIYAAWSDNRNGNYDIFVSRSVDSGATWSTNVQVSSDPGSSDQEVPAMHIQGNRIYLVWRDSRNGPYQDLYFSSSADGISWSPEKRVSDTRGGVVIGRCSLSGSGSSLSLAWNDDRSGKREIYYIGSPDGGITWDNQAARVNADADGYKQDPFVLVDSAGTIFVTWWDERDDGGDIYLALSRDNGKTWVQEKKVNDDQVGSTQWYGTAAFDGSGNIYMIWEDYRNGSGKADIYFARGS